MSEIVERFQHHRKELNAIRSMHCTGRVERVVGLSVEAIGPQAHINELCRLVDNKDDKAIDAEVVGFRNGRVLVMPLGQLEGISTGSKVIATGKNMSIPVGTGLRGRVIDGLGHPIDGKGDIHVDAWYPIDQDPPSPVSRPRIDQKLALGIRAIDSMITCGRGQRLGIFAGSGVGKSTLMGMIARNVEADVNVIALVGERGREVREFIERDLGERGMERSVVVVATSDQPALVRMKSALVATAVAEYFRDCGNDVLLLMDSLTRFAMAHREVGLACGEPPVSRGYPPSLYAVLPRMLERSGRSSYGSITGIYTVLVDGDDINEPVSDAVRSILDGHVLLSRELATQGQYPAIDVLGSVSRLMPDLTTPEHIDSAAAVRRILAIQQEAKDLISIGAYKRGSDAAIDYAMDHIEGVREFLRQKVGEFTPYQETLAWMDRLYDKENVQ